MPKRRAGAPPNNWARGPTKPIAPPQPIAAGFLPKPFSSAVIAASKAGPFGLVIHQFTAPCGLTETLTPHGGSLVSTFLICSNTSSGSWSGTIRQLTIAAAVGSTWFDAPLIELASWAMIVADGNRQVCSYGCTPFIVANETPGSVPISLRHVAS